MAKKTKKAKTTAKAKAKAPAAKASAAKTLVPVAKLNPASSPRTKGEILTILAESTGLSRKEVSTVFANMSELIGKDLGKKGCGMFTVPGLLKIRCVNKPATKARKGINPFTGEETTFKAKPARNVVKVRPLKALKDMV